MLPEFTSIKRRRFEIACEVAKAAAKARHPILAELSTTTQHEGTEVAFVDIEGNVSMDSYEKLESEMAAKHDEIVNFTDEDWFKLLSDFFEQLYRQQVKILFQSLHDVTEKTGNKVSMKGKGLSEDSILEMLRKLKLNFDHPDPLSQLVIAMSPEDAASLPHSPEGSPEYQAAKDEILEQKRLEWRLDSVDQRLVD